ncbi:MAG: ABC transporter substrate-binding protein [Anaerolineae bacterium]|nr:ABC transporter substrate-binding protein [Anaerolineae bacterium]MDW8298147.1 ABC transporter substrate-binding protein [Anaerolineae bacterium]
MIYKRLLVVALASLLALAVLGAPTQAQEKIEIKFVHIFGGQQDSRAQVVEAIAEVFMEQNPNITVTVSSTSTDYLELFNNAILAAEQGQAPHIVQVEDSLIQLATDSGFFHLISDIATPEQLATLDDLLPTVRAYYTLGGKLVGMPWNASNPILYYNRNMFEQAGLDPNAPPKTFAEVLETCEKIMAKKETLGITACINFPISSWFAEQWMAMQNALFVNNDNGRSARATEVFFTSPEMLRIAQFYRDMREKGYYTYTGRVNDYNGEGITFLSKRTAMTISSTAGLTLFQRFSRAQGFELGTAPLITPGPDADNGVTVGGGSVWVTKGHSDAETKAAVDFIFFLTDTENDIKWHKGSGYFPIRQSSIERLTAEGWFEKNPPFAIAINQLRQSRNNIANAGFVVGPSAEVRSALMKGLQSIVDGAETPEAAMAAAKQAAERALADYNAVVGK